MLVLTRRPQEEILIHATGERITIKVLALKGNAVRIGIEAPKEIAVWRGELNVAEEEVTEAA